MVISKVCIFSRPKPEICLTCKLMLLSSTTSFFFCAGNSLLFSVNWSPFPLRKFSNMATIYHIEGFWSFSYSLFVFFLFFFITVGQAVNLQDCCCWKHLLGYTHGYLGYSSLISKNNFNFYIFLISILDLLLHLNISINY